MSNYVLFDNYIQRKIIVKGDNRIMNPLMSGLEFSNPFKIPYNGMRKLPSVQTQELDYNRLKNAYPQERIN